MGEVEDILWFRRRLLGGRRGTAVTRFNPLKPKGIAGWLTALAMGACGSAQGTSGDQVCGGEQSSCTLLADNCCPGLVCFSETCVLQSSLDVSGGGGSTGGSGSGSKGTGSGTTSSTGGTTGTGGTAGTGGSGVGSLCTLAAPGDSSNCPEGLSCADWSAYAQGFGICREPCGNGCPGGESCTQDHGGTTSESCQCTAVNAPGDPGDSCAGVGLVCHPDFHICLPQTASSSCPSGLMYSSLWQLCVVP